jgi:hypothetical protein
MDKSGMAPAMFGILVALVGGPVVVAFLLRKRVGETLEF